MYYESPRNIVTSVLIHLSYIQISLLTPSTFISKNKIKTEFTVSDIDTSASYCSNGLHQ